LDPNCPLGWGRLTGKIRRGRPIPQSSRLHESAQWGPLVEDERPVGWSMSAQQLAKLDKASEVMPAYPYYAYRTQEGFARINPSPV
jgi:hypothetical protein